MGSGRAIALPGLVVGLVGMAPALAVPGVAKAVAQTAEFKLDQWTGDAHPS